MRRGDIVTVITIPKLLIKAASIEMSQSVTVFRKASRRFPLPGHCFQCLLTSFETKKTIDRHPH